MGSWEYIVTTVRIDENKVISEESYDELKDATLAVHELVKHVPTNVKVEIQSYDPQANP